MGYDNLKNALKTFLRTRKIKLLRSAAIIISSLISICCVNPAWAAIERADVFITEDHLDSPGQADIVLEFEKKIIYQGYSPAKEGRFLRVNIRMLDSADTVTGGFFEESIRVPRNPRIPSITATYSFTENRLTLIFSQNTQFTVRPGTDGRSLIITLPLLDDGKPAPTKIRPTEIADNPLLLQSEKALKEAKPSVEVKPVETTAPLVQEKTPTAPEKAPQPESVAVAPPATPPVVVTPPIKQEPVTPPVAITPPAPASAEVEKLAAGFMDESRRALQAKDWTNAVNRLYRVLGLPSNSQTEAAQALVGEAREGKGEIPKARAEYELYLKLFPNGPSADRVRAKLAGLPKAAVVQAERKRELPKERGESEWTYFGSIGTTYYSGQSQTDTSTFPSGVALATQSSLSQTDQKSLISTINLNARRRDNFSDTRIVFRDTDNRNYLNRNRDYNRIYALYVDHSDKKYGYYVRGGRQNPNGIGVLERFDGVQGGYNLSERTRVNAVYGQAVEFDSPFEKKFYGASFEFLPEAGKPGVSLYAIDQTIDGFENRRALGTEARYFDGHITAYGLLDYDTLYKDINIALIQGNYLTDGGTNYFFVVDRRKAPSLSLTNALLTAPGLTLQQIIATQGLQTTRNLVKSVTADSSLYNVGVTYPLSERWQVGFDYRLTEVSATQPVTATVPLTVVGTCIGTADVINNTCTFDTASQNASGKTHTYTFQVTGNSLIVNNAVGLANLSYINAANFDGQSYNLTYLLPVVQGLNLDTNLRYYTQKDNQNATQKRKSASFKLTYHWRNTVYIEGEYGQEIADSASTTQTDHSKRNYFYTGLRYDFR